MGENGPRVSVIVPVRNRRALLRGLLDALGAQTYEDFEVVVVDDGSTDGAAEEALPAQRDGCSVRVVNNPGRGAVAARRAGVATSGAEFLAFTDSDCVPAPGWLAAGVDALARGADLVNGPTVPVRVPGPLERSTASAEEGLYPTSNVFYRRSAYDAVGGFDEQAAARLGFRSGSRARGLGFGEDTLLAWAVRRKGSHAHRADAVVEHHVFPADIGDAVSRTLMMGAFPALVREVPELRTTTLVRGRLFLGSLSRMPLYAALIGWLLRQRRAAALSFCAWVGTRGRQLQRQSPGSTAWVIDLPAVLVLDALAAGVLVAGSVRARTVLL